MVRKSFTFEGKRYFVKAKTEREAFEKMALKRRDLEEGRTIISKNTPVSVWAERWFETYKENSVSSSWAVEIRSILRCCVLPAIGQMPIKQVKPIHLQGVLNTKKGFSLSYLKKIKIVMNEMFDTAKRNNLILENPCEALKLPVAKKNKKRRSLTAYEIKMVLKAAEGFRGGLYYKIMLYCGLRPGEAAALQWRHIDFKAKRLTVCQALKRDGTIGQTKTETGNRKVPIPEVLLLDLEKERAGAYDFVCEKASGGHHTLSSLDRLWRSFRIKVNVAMGCQTFRKQVIPPHKMANDITPYTFRHTYCTNLQAAGVPINVAKEWMGHSDISMTASIYTHQSNEADERAAEMVNAFLDARDPRRAQDTENKSI